MQGHLIHRHLNSLAVFVAVVDEGGFSRGASKLRLSPSVASHHVAKLEEALGVALLRRSTRSVTLTAPGRSLYTAAARVLAITDAACDSIAEDGSNPSGTLRLTLPAKVPDPRLEKAIWAFIERYPNVFVSLTYSDQSLDLIAKEFDIGFRIGPLPDSALKSRKLMEFGMTLVASPSYLAGIARPKTPHDLADTDIIGLENVYDTITLSRGAETITVPIHTHRLMVDAMQAAYQACLAGLGIMWMAESICRDDIDAGRLVEVLPQWSLSRRGLYAVWSGEARRNSLTRRLLESV
ncbi:MAG: LysR family transcriptional regulator, partial [Pseudomonadota bacterium]